MRGYMNGHSLDLLEKRAKEKSEPVYRSTDAISATAPADVCHPPELALRLAHRR
jgi:hypothetical protein